MKKSLLSPSTNSTNFYSQSFHNQSCDRKPRESPQGDEKMISEFKIARYSEMSKCIEEALTQKYKCRITLGESTWLNFCIYIRATGKYDNVVKAMIDSSQLDENEIK